MSHRRPPQPMGKEIAERVKQLHREHGNLGHDGIAHLLADEGLEVDEHELRVFMEEHKLNSGPTGVPAGDRNPLRYGNTGAR